MNSISVIIGSKCDSFGILLSFCIDCNVELNKEKYEEYVESNRLEVKEVRIPTEPLQPCSPQQAHIQNSINSGPNEQKQQVDLFGHK